MVAPGSTCRDRPTWSSQHIPPKQRHFEDRTGPSKTTFMNTQEAALELSPGHFFRPATRYC